MATVLWFSVCVLHIGVVSTSENKISSAMTHSYITSAKEVMLLICLFVSLLLCEQHYSKIYQQVSIILPTAVKFGMRSNLLDFGCDPNQYYDPDVRMLNWDRGNFNASNAFARWQNDYLPGRFAFSECLFSTLT